MNRNLLFVLWLAGFLLLLVGCGAPSKPMSPEDERKAFRGGAMPPHVAAKIKARQKAATPKATSGAR